MIAKKTVTKGLKQNKRSKAAVTKENYDIPKDSVAEVNTEKDLSAVIENQEKILSEEAGVSDEVGKVVNEAKQEAEENEFSVDYSSKDYSPDYISEDLLPEIIPPEPELPPVEEDFAVHKLRKDNDIKEYVEGKKYHSPWNNPFFEYLKENLVNSSKRANILAKRGINSTTGINATTGTLLATYHHLHGIMYKKK